MAPNVQHLQVITTAGSEEEAQRIAQDLVARRLAACVQVHGPITSVYWWQGAMETAQEWQCFIKTTSAVYADVERTIHELHSYEVPEIVALPLVEGSRRYLDWLEKEASGSHPA